MSDYFLRRLIRIFLVWLGISMIMFFMLRLTGDPARNILGEMASAEAVAEFRRQQGLDRPLPEQYLKFLGAALVGDFGKSLRYQQPIMPIILERLPATLELAGTSLLLSFLIGVPLGIFAALKKDKALDFFARGLVLVAQGIPNFFLAILLILLFGVTLRWLPTGGRGTLQHLILPSLVLSFILLPLTVRVTRSAILDVLNQNYVRMARAKGLSENTIMLRHTMQNAALPILTILGLQAAGLLGGSIVTETVFSWPGVGRLIVSAIFARDFPLVQASVLVIASAVVVVNFIVDVLYGVLDPRISTR
jgi:ABC-type dipeptide/oligopeptide/nickel transport system permease component